jgi:hypothetical protein
MKASFNEIILRLMITVIILVMLEIFSSAILPALGIRDYTLAFHVLITIFLGFRFNSSLTPWILLILQIFHSAFSVEGWALATFAALVVCLLINYLKDLMQISSLVSTIIVVAIFQIVWFLVVASVIAAKNNDFSLILPRVMRIIPETIGISLFAPLFFKVLGRVWREKDDEGVTI